MISFLKKLKNINNSFDIPVLVIGFKRPDTTIEVLREVLKQKPQKVYVFLDAPRNEDELNLSNELKRNIDNLEWSKTRVYKNYQVQNKGLRKAIPYAVSWLFDNEKWGIILEDDCVPNDSFFLYCKEVLHKYEHDERIMHISGTNHFQNDSSLISKDSYFFSQFVSVWGWATWRRAWNHFHSDEAFYDRFMEETQGKLFRNENINKFWLENFKQVYKEEFNAWSYAWILSVLSQNGLVTVPNKNLISNIGFREDAVHTTTSDEGEFLSNLPKVELKDEITHPDFLIPKYQIDDKIFHQILKITL